MKEIIKYKWFLLYNIKKDINEKYKGSLLGLLWTFINPLLFALVYTVVFSYILKDKGENYTLFLIVGILVWNYFCRGVSNCTSCIVNNRNLLKKIYFPKIILPFTISISETINFIISCIIIILFVLISGVGLSFNIFYFPLIVITQFLLIFGISLITSALNVYFRDIGNILDFILSITYYVTPVFYSSNLLFDSKIGLIMKINPMTTILNSYRDIFIDKVGPNLLYLFIVFLIGLLITWIGILVFKKLEKNFVEQL